MKINDEVEASLHLFIISILDASYSPSPNQVQYSRYSLAGSRARFQLFREGKYFLSLPEEEPRFVCYPPLNLDTIKKTLFTV
jgi:hypothetical protein